MNATTLKPDSNLFALPLEYQRLMKLGASLVFPKGTHFRKMIFRLRFCAQVQNTLPDYFVSMDPMNTDNPIGDEGPEVGITMQHYMNTGRCPNFARPEDFAPATLTFPDCTDCGL